MGDKWVTSVRPRTTGRCAKPIRRRVRSPKHWEQFTQYLCLGLSQDLGRSVTSPRPKNQTTTGRLDESTKLLATDGALDAILRIPDAVGELRLHADLRARQTLTSVDVDAPREGRHKSRFKWLIRQLADAPNDLSVEVAFPKPA